MDFDFACLACFHAPVHIVVIDVALLTFLAGTTDVEVAIFALAAEVELIKQLILLALLDTALHCLVELPAFRAFLAVPVDSMIVFHADATLSSVKNLIAGTNGDAAVHADDSARRTSPTSAQHSDMFRQAHAAASDGID